MDFTVISFFTNDWMYPEYAAKLRNDCDRLNLRHHIVERKSTNRYVGNCQIKPFFVQECMETLRSPVFWMDADGSILQRPDKLFDDENINFDLVANQPIHDAARIHVGSMLMNYTDAMRNFVDLWCQSIIRKSPLDDAAFNGTWDHHKNSLRVKLLPDNYFFIQRHANDPAPADVVIMHRLSRSELKERYKAGER